MSRSCAIIKNECGDIRPQLGGLHYVRCNEMKHEIIAQCCSKRLDLENAKLSDEYYYKSLSLCVIDAVFSIGIRYAITRNVVRNFCNKLLIERLREDGSPYPPIEHQFSIEALLNLYDQFSINEITDNFFCSRNRTSSKNGILKSEAVSRFCTELKEFGVNYFQDLPLIIGNDRFENSIKKIPGQGSGLSTSYFYMLAGEENVIKADRMIIRFIESCIHLVVTTTEASQLIMEAHEILREEFPSLTPRILDHEIWKYQRRI